MSGTPMVSASIPAARQETGSTRGETFLRGTQFTDADGQVRFATIYPGWYPGRTPHIHFKVFLDAVSLVIGQLYFPDPVTEHVYATLPPYRERQAERDTLTAFSVGKAAPTPAVEPELALRGRASRRLADCFTGRGTAFSAASPMERAA